MKLELIKQRGLRGYSMAYQSIPILSDIFGTKPQIAPYIPTDYTQEQLKAVQENIGAFPDITQLGNLYEQYMMGQFSAAGFPLQLLVEGGVGLTQQEMAQANKMLEGQIPPDVAAQVARSGAYQSLTAGLAGGPMAGALTARDLGLTSLDLINRGAGLAGQAGNAAQQWQGIAGAATLDPRTMFVTPQQRAQLDMENRLWQQATLQRQYDVAAAPNPIAKGLSDIVENLTAAYLGGKVGQIGAGNAAATQAADAFGPQMESAFQGYDAFGNPISTGGPGGGPTNVAAVPTAAPSSDYASFASNFYNQSPYGTTGYSPFGFGGDWGIGQYSQPPLFGFGAGGPTDTSYLTSGGSTTDLWGQSPFLTGQTTPFGFGG